VPGATDQVDLNISVTEKPTGNILLGAGFGSEGIILSGGITQQNVFGTGNHIGVQVNSSKVNTVYSLSFTQPYWTVDGVSRGFDVYKRNFDPIALSLGQYRTSTVGGVFRLGVPFTDIDTITLGLGYEDTKITVYDNSPLRITNYVNTFGEDNTSVLGNVGWLRDTRDSAIYPTSGAISRAFLETGLPGGTLRFYKLNVQHQRYFPLTRNFTFYMNGDIGYGNGFGGKPLPFYRNYYVGGVSSLRGYYAASVGPKDSDGNPTGGSKKVVGSAELLFPFPGLENDKSVRLGAFVDAGVVDETYKFSQARASVGMSLLWVSPFGPIKISAAEPLRSQVGDKKQVLQFTFGTQF
jgi:outer membrane protein insertion porin family